MLTSLVVGMGLLLCRDPSFIMSIRFEGPISQIIYININVMSSSSHRKGLLVLIRPYSSFDK